MSVLPHGRPGGPAGSFCWLDLAATDAAAAMRFYGQAFGWRFETQAANGGHFVRCLAGGRAVASLYPLAPAQAARGVPSHWTPYLRVAAADAAVERVASLGGRVVVAPFDVEGIARIALVEDGVGALLGLWQAGTAAESRARRRRRPAGG